MILAAPAAPVELSLALQRGDAMAGADLGLRIVCSAREDVDVTAVQVALVGRMAFLAKHGGLLGVGALTRGRRTEVRWEREIPGTWPLARGESVSLPVQVHVPEDVIGTSRSDLVNVDWLARVRLSARGFTYAQATAPIVVRSHAGERAFVAMSVPHAEDRGVAALRFSGLSTRVLAPGRRIEGGLLVAPLQSGVARAVRVRLLLRQVVHRGIWQADAPERQPEFQRHERDSTIVGLTVAEDLALVPGQELELPFALPPRATLPAPSVDAPPFRLSWMLRAELDRGARRRPFVEVELHGRTAS